MMQKYHRTYHVAIAVKRYFSTLFMVDRVEIVLESEGYTTQQVNTRLWEETQIVLTLSI